MVQSLALGLAIVKGGIAVLPHVGFPRQVTFLRLLEPFSLSTEVALFNLFTLSCEDAAFGCICEN